MQMRCKNTRQKGNEMTSKKSSAGLGYKVARMRHNSLNYDKNLDLMYNNDGQQTDLREYINRVLSEIATGKRDHKDIIQLQASINNARKNKNIEQNNKNRIKKIMSKQPKAQNDEKSLNSLLKGMQKYNKKIEKQEEKIHRQYVQVMLHKIGLSNKQLSVKLIGKLEVA